MAAVAGVGVSDLTSARLRALLDYDPDTGVFTRLVSRGGHAAGEIAGTLDGGTGYIKIYVDGRNYWAHRLAWLHVHSAWPSKQIDHRDLQRSNNRLANLREATHGQNVQNTGRRSTNTSGYIGASWHRGTQKWLAQIVAEGEHHYLGLHDTPLGAHLAYVAAAARLHGEFARTE